MKFSSTYFQNSEITKDILAKLMGGADNERKPLFSLFLRQEPQQENETFPAPKAVPQEVREKVLRERSRDAFPGQAAGPSSQEVWRLRE